jgi:hypothetical protein
LVFLTLHQQLEIQTYIFLVHMCDLPQDNSKTTIREEKKAYMQALLLQTLDRFMDFGELITRVNKRAFFQFHCS